VSLNSTHTTHQYHVKIIDNHSNSVPKEFHVSKCSLLLSCAADGTAYPTVLLCGEVNVPVEFSSDATPLFHFVSSSPSGFMKKDVLAFIFEEYLIPEINNRRKILCKEDEPVLIVVDGHTSRLNYDLFNLCMFHNIDMICLPSHTSHILQPLDAQVNSAFKNMMSRYRSYEELQNQSEMRSAFLKALKVSVSFALQHQTIVHSWDKCGLFPFQPKKILSELPIFPPKYLRSNIDNEKD
jgi:uncharacterized protein YnzC (UPF0291/DUF896 family)